MAISQESLQSVVASLRKDQPTAGGLHVDGYASMPAGQFIENKPKKRKKVKKGEGKTDAKVLKHIRKALEWQEQTSDPNDRADQAVLELLTQALMRQEEDMEGHSLEGPQDEAMELGEEAEMGKAEVQVNLIKSEYQQIVYGVVLEPELRDSQDDVVDQTEIEKAAHDWLFKSREHDIQHTDIANDAIYPVESYIAPQDLTIEGEPVSKGSWVMVIKVEDKQVWQDIVDGKITGLSMGGSAFRLPEV